MRGSQNFLMCSAVFSDAVPWSWDTKNVAIWFAIMTSFSGVPDFSGEDMFVFLDTVRMRENFKPVVACDRGQGHAGGLRRADRKCRRRRNRNQNRNSDRRSFLNQLDRKAAGEQTEAAAPGKPLPRKHTCKLVERIMAANILTQCDHAVSAPIERRAVHGASLLVDRLHSRQCVEGRHDVPGGKARRIID